jgi:hypothetical protein
LTITNLHLETRAFIEKEGKKTRAEILNALKTPESVGSDNQQSQNVTFNKFKDSWNEHYRVQDIILQSLQFPTMTDRYEAIKEAHAKTCKWIFQKAQDVKQPWSDFSEWLEHGNGIYWISGKAGSGKSTLMRYIRDNSRLQALLKS